MPINVPNKLFSTLYEDHLADCFGVRMVWDTSPKYISYMSSVIDAKLTVLLTNLGLTLVAPEDGASDSISLNYPKHGLTNDGQC